MTSRPIAARPLALAIALVLPGTALADPPEQAVRLDTLIVTGTPLQQSAEDLARPWEVLSGAELERSKSVTLGETLDSIPGVHAGYFGPGVGRPIIRGLEGGRVQVLTGGMSALDVSTVSVDHATTIEPFLADQIEVLKGPGTLLYGSGALGGAVNVVDGRIPEQVPDADSGLTGRAELRGNTVNDERTGMVRLDGGGGNFAFNVNLLSRDTNDFKIPGEAERHHDDDDHDHGRDDDHDDHGHRLENSALRTRAASFGASLIGDRGFVGTAMSMFDTRYGLPGHAHDDHDDHGHGHDGGHGHDHDHDDDHDDDEEVFVDLRQRRVDFKAGLYNPYAGHDSLTVRVSRTDYTHTEFEDGDVGTVFENEGLEARIEATHHEFGGWRGAYGLQFGRRDLNAFGDEAFVPANVTRDLGLFLIEEKNFDRFKLELGGRVDRTRVKPEDSVSRRFTTGSASVAGRFKLTEDFHLLGGLDHVQRAPTAEELYSNGLHVATRSYELGDASLGREKANRVELGFHWHAQRLDLTGAVYHTDFSDFIYLANTDASEDGLPVRLWTQADTRFTGAELEARFLLAETQLGRWQARAFGDYVRASFKGDQSRTVDIAIPHGNHFHNHTVDLDLSGALPRIPAGRIGVGLDWDRDHWRAGVGAVHYTSQDRVAQFETPSDSYTLVNANLAYHWDMRNMGWEVFLDGRNLTNAEARPHTSFLRDLAPLPGRSLAFGVRMHF